MKILHITKKYPNAIGGDAICVSNLEREQANAGHDVFILTTNSREIVNKKNLFKFGLRDTACNWDRPTLKRCLSLILLLPKSFFVIKKLKPDIIHSHSSDLGFIASLWARAMGIPIINTCHGLTFPYKFLNKLQRYPEMFFLKFGFFDKIITVDPNSMDYFFNHGIKNCEYFNMVAVEADEFKKQKKTIYLSSKHKYIKFLFVGRMDPLKGLDYLIESVEILKNKYFDHFEVWIIGDGLYRKRLEAKSIALNLDKNIIFFKSITSRKRLIKMYCLADIFISPSLLETFSLAILEACAAGLAVIGTNIGVVASMREGENVLKVLPRDAGSLSSAMLNLMTDNNLYRKIAHNGGKLVDTAFSWKIVSNNLKDLYNTLSTKNIR